MAVGVRRALDIWILAEFCVNGRRVNIIFAVYLQSRGPAVRAAVPDADTDEVLGPPGPASLPFSSGL